MNAYIQQRTPNPIPGQNQINYNLSTNSSLFIGRDPSKCQLILDSKYYPEVSRVHLEIRPVNYPSTYNSTTWEIYDSSSNGTYINGGKIQQKYVLRSGDIIKLGKTGIEFTFHAPTPINNNQPPLSPSNINNNDSLHFSHIFPVVSKDNKLFAKGFLIPGILSVIFVVSLFATIGNFEAFSSLLAIYLGGLGYYFIYYLCGKNKPWWLLVGITISEMILLVSPILGVILFIFRELLPGDVFGLPEGAGFFSHLLANFFGAGLAEELLKAIPVFILMGIASRLQSPWREKIGVVEPLDGIVMVAASGLGFTLLETLGQYVPSVIEQTGEVAIGLQLLIPRIIGSVFGHMAYSGYFGYFIGLAMLKPSKRWQLLAIGWLTSSVLHGFWNASASLSSYVTAIAGIVAYIFLVAAILKARQLSPTRSQNFATQFHPPNHKP
jgi:RsiW-degrading membrane proteinase PrsW (M82 family)